MRLLISIERESWLIYYPRPSIEYRQRCQGQVVSSHYFPAAMFTHTRRSDSITWHRWVIISVSVELSPPAVSRCYYL